MRENIMVIDDDEKITSMLRRGLAFEGYSVVTATNGADGLKQMLTIRTTSAYLGCHDAAY